MAKAGLLFVGTDDGLVLFSNPGAVGRWLRVGHELRGAAVPAVWVRQDNPLLVVALCAPGGVRISRDGGQTWDTPDSAPAAAASGGGALVALGGKEPTLLLAGAGLWRSADDGATWDAGDTESPIEGGVTALASAGYHIDTAFAGSGGGQLFQTTDRGRSWQLLKAGLPPVRAIGSARLA